MSAETRSLALTYTPLQGGDGESRWLRVEQVETGNAHLTVAEAAELIDSLFDLEPCDDGMGGGGEEADPDKDPDAGKFDSKMAALLSKAGLCNRSGGWTTEVDVFRSHKAPANYELRGERVTVEATRPMRGSKRQVVDVSGAVIELEWPYDGGLSGIPAGVKWQVRGSTVNLDRPINGRLILRYDAWWERVTLNILYAGVAEDKKIDDMILALAVSGGASDRALGANKPTAAAVVAFWGDLAASCGLEPPEEDPNGADVDVDEVCGEGDDEPDHDWEDASGCWKTVAHYQLCECSRKRVNEWEEQAGAPCDGSPSGAQVGHEEKFDGYVGGWICGDDEYDRELRTPDFYMKHCCKPLQFSPSRLPGCREYYAVYKGGAAIENGPEHWKNIYGSDVRMIAVMPENGICGEVITRWNIPSKNCCDGVEPMTPHPNNPEEIWPGRSYAVGVEGGKKLDAEFRWSASGGIVFRENDSATITTTGPSVWIRAEENICPNPTVTVTDGCSTLTMTFSGPGAEPPELSQTDMPVDPGGTFSLGASGGVRPYMWQASGGIEIVGWSADGGAAYFRAGERDAWCVGEITVIDQCGQSATCTVRNSQTGKWVYIYDFDICSPPGAGAPPETPGAHRNSRFWAMPHGGYRVQVYGEERQNQARLKCPVGNVISPREAELRETCSKKNNPNVYDWSYSNGDCVWTRKSDGYTVHYYDADYALQVQRWICGE